MKEPINHKDEYQWRPITSESNDEHNDFFIEVHLLADKLLLVVAIHSLGGSRANWHHTPNPQLGATQPTQDEDHTRHEQSTRVPFGSLPGKGQEPLVITTTRAEDKHLPSLDDPHCSKLVAAITKSNKQIPQQNKNTKCL